MRFLSLLRSVLLLVLFCCPGFTAASEDRIVVYIDADYSVSPAPAQAIELGLRAAFVGTWAEDIVQIVPRDHRTNARRSIDNLRDAWNDPYAVAIVGGKQSPPYIIHGEAINAAQTPLLLAWSAASVLTRIGERDDNWIFRLSVDDSKAALALLNDVSSRGCQSVALTAVDNPWGRGNVRNLREVFKATGRADPPTYFLPTDAGSEMVENTAQEIADAELDCVILVTVSRIGHKFLNALGSLDRKPMVTSHWGLLGPRMTQNVDFETLEALQVRVLGTCGLQRAEISPDLANTLSQLSPGITGTEFRPDQHPAPHGFFHAYDLGKLLLASIETASDTDAWDQGIQSRRRAIRDALYNLNPEIVGLLKVYERPFRRSSRRFPDGHEALGPEDLCMSRIGSDGVLLAAE